MREETNFCKSHGEVTDSAYFPSCVTDIEKEAQCQGKDTIAMYRILRGSDAPIYPLHCILTVWSLTGDDIGVGSIGGTNTGVNVSAVTISMAFTDEQYRKNETQIWNNTW